MKVNFYKRVRVISARTFYRESVSVSEVFESKDIRRAPRLLQAIGPLAFGVTDGDDAKIDVPKMGKFGMGDVTKTLVQFTPGIQFSMNAFL